MANVYTKKSRFPRTLSHRDFGGLVAPPPDEHQKENYVPPPGFLYPYVKDKYGKQQYTVWTPKPVIIRWETPEYKFNYRWMNFTCGLKDEAPKPIDKLPPIRKRNLNVKHDMRTTYRSMYKEPNFSPEIYGDLPKTKFSYKIIEDEAVGIIPALPTYKYGPFNFM